MADCCCSAGDTVGAVSSNAPTPCDKNKQGPEMTVNTASVGVFLEDIQGEMGLKDFTSVMQSFNAQILEVCEDIGDDMPVWSEPEPPKPVNEEKEDVPAPSSFGAAMVVVEEGPPMEDNGVENGKVALKENRTEDEDRSAQAAFPGSDFHKTKTTLATRFLRAGGECIGSHPGKVCGFNLVVMLICLPLGWHKAEFLGGDGFVPDITFAKLWTEKGGDLQEELDTMEQWEKKDWIDDYHLMMAYGRGDNAGKNAINPQAFGEMLDVIKLWHSIQVTTTRGNIYSSYDLCKRGIVPDLPQAWNPTGQPPLPLPCLVVTPLLCFREYAAVGLHPTYQFIDQLLGAGQAPASISSWKSFITRPSFATMTPEEMLEEISTLRPDQIRGCQLFTGGTLGPNLYLGEINPPWRTASENFSSAGGIRSVFYYDSPGTIQFRLNFTKPHLTKNLDDIKEAIEAHGKKFSAEIFAMSDRNSNGFFEFTNLRPGGLEAAADKGREVPAGLLILGICLLYTYFFLVNVDFVHPSRSRALVATNGFFVILMALVTSLSIYFALDGTLNVAVVVGVPLLQLGLAADDMFVIIHYFNDLGEDFIRSRDQHIVMGELCMRCSMGVVVTSLCNFISFLIGTFVPLRGLSDFCKAVAICALVNLFFVMTEFLPFMCLEIRRIKSNRPDYHPFVYICHRRALRSASGGKSDKASTCKDRISAFLKDVYAPFLLWWPVKSVLTIVSLAFLTVMSLKVFLDKDIGWNPGAIAADGTEANKALPMLFEHFQMFPISLCFRPSLDVVANQQNMLELFAAVSSTTRTTGGTSIPYLSIFYLYLARMSSLTIPAGLAAAQGLPNTTTYADIGWKTNPDWTHPVLAPYGLGPTDPQIFYQAYHTLSKPPFAKDDWVGSKEQVQGASSGTYINFDLAGNQKYTFGPKPLEQFQFSTFGFQAVDLYTDQDIVDAIKETMKLVEDSPLKDHAFINALTFSYWRAFMDLEKKMWILLSACLGSIGVVTIFLLGSVVGALVGMMCSAMIAMEMFGFCMLFLKFNPFVVASLLSGIGLSVEFISHTVAAFFIEESGSVKSKLGQAMKQTFIPVLHGSISTALAVAPLILAPVQFITEYQCLPVFILIFIGFLNSFIFLPAMLGLAQCPKKG